ncbi:MAG TPA: Uma2 family endonuclease, partial [Polyangiaceae bacterium]|nr:Uma2 family endonuclease [Polyangiaceae bacterium]
TQRRLANSLPGEPPRYVEPVVPVIFPESAEVPETQLHFEVQTILYQLLFDHLGPDITVGSNQFVYFNAAEPKQCLAPDVYVRLAPRGAPIRSWKVWERGAPEIAVEIVSDDDREADVWELKLRRYRQLGVSELVRFDPEASGTAALRIWDRVDGALLERELTGASAPSVVLNFDWVLAPADGFELALRIGVGEDGRTLLLTRAEARKVEAEARQAAEARVRELEAELARRSDPK